MILSLLLLPVVAAAPAPFGLADQIDDTFRRAEAFGFSGALLVAKDGKVILAKGYGYADAKSGSKVDEHTVFSVASITKPVTATAILQLMEKKKLKLDDRITRFFKDVPEEMRSITVFDLLTHTAGIEDEYAAAGIKSGEQAAKAILAKPLIDQVGAHYHYSNDGYTLLAAIVEEASGTKYEEFVRKHQFAVAGMTESGFFGGKFPSAKVAHSYNSGVDNGPANVHSDDWGDMGSGNLLTSVADLYKWSQAWEHSRLLSATTRARIFERTIGIGVNGGEYGLGWMRFPTEQGTWVRYHGGADIPRGYTSESRFYASEGVSTIVFVNTMRDELGLNRAVRDPLQAMIFGGRAALPPPPANASNVADISGRYRLDKDSTIVIRKSLGAWTLCAEGQTAIDQALALAKEPKARMQRLSERVRASIEDAKQGKFGDLITSETWGEIAPFGNYRILGSAPLSSSEPYATTYVRFAGERGEWSARWVWRGDNAYVIRGDVLPLQMPLVCRGTNSYEGYDLLLQRGVRVRLVGSPKGRPTALELSSAAGTAIVKRAVESN